MDKESIINILEDCCAEQYERYTVYEKLIAASNWNVQNDNVTIPLIAMYIVLNNPPAKNDIDEKTLSSIRKAVSSLKIKIYTQAIRQNKYDYYTDDTDGKTLHEIYLYSILGDKYAKYFIRDFNDINFDNITYEQIRDTDKKYLTMNSKLWASTEENELSIIKRFIDDIEEKSISHNLSSLYRAVDKYNKNYKANNKGKVHKAIKLSRTTLDTIMKKSLSQRLKKIGISDSKVNRLTNTTIKAIKSELLK